MLTRWLFAAHFWLWLINPRFFLAGSAANQLQKSVLFAAGLAALMSRQKNRYAIFCVSAIIAMTAASAIFSDFRALSVERYLQSAFSLLTVLLPICVFYTRNDQIFFTRMIAFLPILCLLFGVVYQIGGLHQLFYTDFLGVSRLQGSSIPSGIGGIGFLGCIAAMQAAGSIRERYYILVGVNFLILLLSAARMPFACAAFVCLMIFYTQHLKRISTFVASSIFLSAIGVMTYIVIGDRIVNRFASESGSGRDIIWASLQAVLNLYPYFGIGLGHQILVIPESVMEKAQTIAAHNEYLRLALETGYVGATVIFSLYISVFLVLFFTSRIYRNAAFLCTVASFFIYCLTDNVISSNMSFFVFILAMAYPSLLQSNRNTVRLKDQSLDPAIYDISNGRFDARHRQFGATP